jgi:hypothetical protein
VLGVRDFSCAAEFGLISFIAGADQLHMLTGPALTPDFYGAQILPYVAIGLSLSLFPFIHSLTHIIRNKPAKLPLNAPRRERRYFITFMTSSNNLN